MEEPLHQEDLTTLNTGVLNRTSKNKTDRIEERNR